MRHAIEQMASDVRYALRRLRLSPVFATVATLSLALGIGANVAIFSLANAVLLKRLPVHEPQRLVQLTSGDVRRFSFLTYPVWEQIRDRDDLFDGACAWTGWRFNLARQGEVDYASGILASGELFEVLGVRAVLGRTFTRADDWKGGGDQGPVAVISYAYWQSRYGGKPDVLGKSITLDGRPFTIIGVTPASFFGVEVGRSFSIAVPLSAEASIRGNASSLDRPDVWWLRVLARLKPDQQPEQALAALHAVQPAIREATLAPTWSAEQQGDYLRAPFRLVEAATGTSGFRLQYRTALFVLMGAVGLVLLIACANLANLLLARAAARRQETAIRLALGASRARLARQLLTESLVLSIGGATLGLAFARWASQALVHQLSSRSSQVSLDLSLDWRVLAFTTAVAIATALLFGAAPAIRTTARLQQALIGARTESAVRGRLDLERLFAVVQVALSVVLLFGAGLFVRSFERLLTENTGFDRRNLLVISLDLERTLTPPGQRMRVVQQVLESVRAVPGVEAAAATVFAPLSGAWAEAAVAVPGFEAVPPKDRQVYFNAISEDYFRTMAVPFLAGHDFPRSDARRASPIAIVNHAFARKFFGRTNPVGRTFTPDGVGATEIVGVVADTKYRSLREPAPPTVFRPASQRQQTDSRLHLVVRAGGDLTTLPAAVGAAIARVNDAIALETRTLDRDVADALIRERLLATLSGFMGLLALLVAGIGLYGVMSLAVVRRRREIGVRLALGAFPHSVFWMILRDIAIVTTLGLIAGSVIALTSARFVSSLLFGLEPADLVTLAATTAILSATAALAASLPARRASRSSPSALLGR
jgi:putative ABC transport system permease protein